MGPFRVVVCPPLFDHDLCLFQAAKDHLFRLDKACFVGDDIRDMEAAEQAGCSGVLWKNEEGFPDLDVLVKRVLKNSDLVT